MVKMSFLCSLAALFGITLAACGGGGHGGGGTPSPSPSPITISDPMSYLAQSRGTNGDPSTPLHNYDPLIYRRFDFGHVQASESFLTSPTTALTTWEYSPWGGFVDANGDGGEGYELQGNTVRITTTKNPRVPTAAISWVVMTTSTVNCSQGWTQYDLVERGCRAVVTYPGIGPVDTVISEHLNPVEQFAERIFLAKGWGRLAWQTFRASGTPAGDRCPDFGQNVYQGWVLTDCRYAVNIEPSDGMLTGAMMWHP